MTTTAKAVLGLFAFCLLTIGVQTWRVRSAKRAGAEAAIAPAKAIAAEATQEEQKASAALTARIDTVTRTVTRTRVDTFLVAPKTPADTAHALAQLPTLVTEHAALQRSCTDLANSCLDYRAKAERRFRADSLVIATQGAWIGAGLTPRRWSVGVTAGYGATLNTGHVYTGPSVAVGLSWRIF